MKIPQIPFACFSVGSNYPTYLLYPYTSAKSDSPDEDKSVHDCRLLIPTLKNFFLKHPLINPKTFLSDATFNIVILYPHVVTSHIHLSAFFPLSCQLSWYLTTRSLCGQFSISNPEISHTSTVFFPR